MINYSLPVDNSIINTIIIDHIIIISVIIIDNSILISNSIIDINYISGFIAGIGIIIQAVFLSTFNFL